MNSVLQLYSFSDILHVHVLLWYVQGVKVWVVWSKHELWLDCPKKCECSFTGKLVYERIFRKSSTFTPGSNIPTMLPGKDFETNKTISIQVILKICHEYDLCACYFKWSLWLYNHSLMVFGCNKQLAKWSLHLFQKGSSTQSTTYGISYLSCLCCHFSHSFELLSPLVLMIHYHYFQY